MEAELLVREAAGLTRAAYFGDLPPAPGWETRLAALLDRRLGREPLAGILCRREFYGLEFEVGPAVLVPRPESELLVEVALAEIRAGDIVVDVGTGSGCLAVSIAVRAPQATVVGVDLSRPALALARRNAARHRATCSLVAGDLLAGIRRADVVVANLPYIPTAAIPALQPEVRDWEPRTALDGGPDGLTLIRRLVADCGSRLRPRLLALEVGLGQASAVNTLCREQGAATDVLPDLTGIERVVRARWA